MANTKMTNTELLRRRRKRQLGVLGIFEPVCYAYGMYRFRKRHEKWMKLAKKVAEMEAGVYKKWR